MTGIVNSTGARSGVIGTIVGTPAPSAGVVQVQFRGLDTTQVIGDGGSSGMTFTNIGVGVSGEEFSIDMSVSSGNKVIGFCNVNIGGNSRYNGIQVYMDSTKIACGTETGTSLSNLTVSSMDNTSATSSDVIMFNSSFSFNYTPADTSSHTYSVKAANTNDGTAKTYINMPLNQTNSNYIHRGYSSFILMEVKQ